MMKFLYHNKKFKTKQIWTRNTIAFASILISTSVAFILIFTAIIPIAALPTFKIMAGGLPVKITGYLFGPFIGVIVGVLSDLISFMFLPTYFHYWYTIAFGIAGLIPGVIGYYMNRRWRSSSEQKRTFAKSVNNINFIFTLLILSCILVCVFMLIYMQPDSVFENTLISNRWIFMGISLFGVGTMLIAVILFRFFLKPKTFNKILPIITFSALLELVNTNLTTLGDMAVFGASGSFLEILTAHLLLSPIKIWGNMAFILLAYNIAAPIIAKKTSNGWI